MMLSVYFTPALSISLPSAVFTVIGLSLWIQGTTCSSTKTWLIIGPEQPLSNNRITSLPTWSPSGLYQCNLASKNNLWPCFGGSGLMRLEDSFNSSALHFCDSIVIIVVELFYHWKIRRLSVFFSKIRVFSQQR